MKSAALLLISLISFSVFGQTDSLQLREGNRNGFNLGLKGRVAYHQGLGPVIQYRMGEFLLGTDVLVLPASRTLIRDRYVNAADVQGFDAMFYGRNYLNTQGKNRAFLELAIGARQLDVDLTGKFVVLKNTSIDNIPAWSSEILNGELRTRLLSLRQLLSFGFTTFSDPITLDFSLGIGRTHFVRHIENDFIREEQRDFGELGYEGLNLNFQFRLLYALNR